MLLFSLLFGFFLAAQTYIFRFPVNIDYDVTILASWRRPSRLTLAQRRRVISGPIANANYYLIFSRFFFSLPQNSSPNAQVDSIRLSILR